MSMTTTASRLRIDKLTPGSTVTLDFYYGSNLSHTDRAIFTGVVGEGDTRRACFLSNNNDEAGSLYEWEAYRYDGRWAYGTSADRISLVSVDLVLS